MRMQRLFSECDSKVKGLFGGNRSGKTEEGAEYLNTKCLAKPNQRWWACAESFSDSVAVQQRKVWELAPKNRIKYGTYTEVNGFANRKLIFDNGSIITFKSYDQQRESFQSDDIDCIWNDEEPPYDIYKEQRMRLLDRDGEMIFTMTSLKGVTELLQEVFEDHDVIETQHSPLLDKELPRIIEKNGMRFFMLWTTENPYITQDRVGDEIALMTKDEILSRIHGVPVNLSGRVYPTFSKNIHVIPWEMIPQLGVCLYHILDPHDRKPWAMSWIAVDKTNTAYVVAEHPCDKNFNDVEFDDKDYDDYADLIRAQERTLLKIFGRRVCRRIIDPNFGHKTVQLAKRQGGQAHTTPVKELRKRGLRFVDGIDAIEPGHLAVRQALRWDEKEGILVVQPRLLFADHCRNHIRHMSRYSRKDPTTPDGDVKNKVGLKEKYKDYADLVRYFEMDNPKYRAPKKVAEETEGKMY